MTDIKTRISGLNEELTEREANQKVRLEEMAIFAAQAEFFAKMDVLYAA